MVKTHVLYDGYGAIVEATKFERKNTDPDDQYVKLEVFEKLLSIAKDLRNELRMEGLWVDGSGDFDKFIKEIEGEDG